MASYGFKWLLVLALAVFFASNNQSEAGLFDAVGGVLDTVKSTVGMAGRALKGGDTVGKSGLKAVVSTIKNVMKESPKIILETGKKILKVLKQVLNGKPVMAAFQAVNEIVEEAGELTKRSNRQREETMDVIGLINHWGYDGERHKVHTEDGYILEVHRITSDKDGKSNKGKQPVLVQHGLLCSSADWVNSLPHQSIGFILADAGYDVWLGNYRGNYYSRHHVSLDPDNDKRFWAFSWQEMADHDLPSMIDYILDKTAHRKIQYIGHSMGTTGPLALLSTHEGYNDKIISAQLMSPATTLETSRTVTILKPVLPTLDKAFQKVGSFELLPKPKDLKTSPLCSNFPELCLQIYDVLVDNVDHTRLNKTRLPVLFSHMPAGASLQTIVHYGQGGLAKQFQKFDHGPSKNQQVYQQSRPPKYDLSLIRTPIYLYWGDFDAATSPADVKKIADELTSLKKQYRIPGYNHINMMWATDAHEEVYSKILSNMKIEA